MPETGAEMQVGDIRVTEANIDAGAKYMDTLLRDYFPDALFSEDEGPLFAFASYNAGPGNIARVRTEAAKRGLDPDKVVQQRRTDCRGEDWPANSALRTQHLQVLRRLQTGT